MPYIVDSMMPGVKNWRVCRLCLTADLHCLVESLPYTLESTHHHLSHLLVGVVR